jgi:hypothetical protein
MIDLYDSGRTQETVISSTDGTTTGTYIASYSNHPLLFGANAGSSATAKMTLVSNGNLLVGTTSDAGQKLQVNGDANINGTLTATVKSFIIDHPTKPEKRLQYGVLEGPEHSVYVRGRLKNTKIITLLEHWPSLVHEDTITVNLTPIGKNQNLWVEKITAEYITIGSDSDEVEYFYAVFAERKDIDKLITEFDK